MPSRRELESHNLMFIGKNDSIIRLSNSQSNNIGRTDGIPIRRLLLLLFWFIFEKLSSKNQIKNIEKIQEII